MADYLGRIGQQVGEYRLLRWLGGGGFGHVYQAEQVRDRGEVTVKLLRVRISRSEELKGFINEARTIRMRHPHIVPLLDFGISEEDIPFIVMEYVAGGTLRDRYSAGSRVPLPLVASYAHQIASALQYAHKQHLIHRDVKPQNMLLRADDTVLLSDFGLMTVAHSPESAEQHEMLGGTIAYMAPEQIRGQPQAASDQYSLAIVIYEWITGRRPFGGNGVEVAVQHIKTPPPSLLTHIPTLAPAINKVILKALAKDPSERFATVQDFAQALAQAIHEAPSIAELCEPLSTIKDEEPIISPNESSLLISSEQTGPLLDWGGAPEL